MPTQANTGALLCCARAQHQPSRNRQRPEQGRSRLSCNQRNGDDGQPALALTTRTARSKRRAAQVVGCGVVFLVQTTMRTNTVSKRPRAGPVQWAPAPGTGWSEGEGEKTNDSWLEAGRGGGARCVSRAHRQRCGGSTVTAPVTDTARRALRVARESVASSKRAGPSAVGGSPSGRFAARPTASTDRSDRARRLSQPHPRDTEASSRTPRGGGGGGASP